MSPKTLTLAQRLGSQPVDTPRKPAVNTSNPSITQVAADILDNMPQYKIFRRGDEYLTVQRGTDINSKGLYPVDQRNMTANRLCSFLEQYMIFTKTNPKNEKVPTQITLSKPLAEKILESDIWHQRTPELHSVHFVRLPQWSTDPQGRRTITLSEPGYNPNNGNYTAETLNYSQDFTPVPPSKLQAVWVRLMHNFPWESGSKEEANQSWTLDGVDKSGPYPITNRSACCTLALMLGQYCRLLTNQAPIGIFNGNQPGSGKSLLAWLCVAPTWGMAPGSGQPESKEEIMKMLSSYLMARKPYIMFDDIPILNGNLLNMLATSPEIEGRKLGGNELFTTTNTMQIFATGNGLTTSPDIERRSLIVDLFLSEDALTRTVPNVLTKESICKPEWRADLLRFLWSLVSNWRDKGCPVLVPSNAKASFESFADVVGSIMIANGWSSPFQPRITTGQGGDQVGRAMQKLLAHIAGVTMHADNNAMTATYNLDKILEITDYLGLTETLATAKDKKKSLGWKLARYRGRILTDTRGRKFELGRDEDSAQTIYTFHIHPEPQPQTTEQPQA